MTAEFKVEHIADTDINDAEEPLVSPFELPLVKYLHRNDG
jgi:hypothetical protein